MSIQKQQRLTAAKRREGRAELGSGRQDFGKVRKAKDRQSYSHTDGNDRPGRGRDAPAKHRGDAHLRVNPPVSVLAIPRAGESKPKALIRFCSIDAQRRVWRPTQSTSARNDNHDDMTDAIQLRVYGPVDDVGNTQIECDSMPITLTPLFLGTRSESWLQPGNVSA